MNSRLNSLALQLFASMWWRIIKSRLSARITTLKIWRKAWKRSVEFDYRLITNWLPIDSAFVERLMKFKSSENFSSSFKEIVKALFKSALLLKKNKTVIQFWIEFELNTNRFSLTRSTFALSLSFRAITVANLNWLFPATSSYFRTRKRLAKSSLHSIPPEGKSVLYIHKNIPNYITWLLYQIPPIQRL